MGNKFKDKNVKNYTYYFFDNMMNIKSFDSIKIKIEENSYKNYSYILHWIYEG